MEKALEGRSSKSLRAERARMWWVVGGGAVTRARMLRVGEMVMMTPWRVSDPAMVVWRRTLFDVYAQYGTLVPALLAPSKIDSWRRLC